VNPDVPIVGLVPASAHELVVLVTDMLFSGTPVADAVLVESFLAGLERDDLERVAASLAGSLAGTLLGASASRGDAPRALLDAWLALNAPREV